jgi:hypothetical protein
MRFMLLLAVFLSAVIPAACSDSCYLYPVPLGCTFNLDSCSCIWSDGGIPNPQDAFAGSDDVEALPSCGNGIAELDLGEECDLGSLNGVCLDASGNPPDAGQWSTVGTGCPLGSWDLGSIQVCNCPQGTKVFCTTTCEVPWPSP